MLVNTIQSGKPSSMDAPMVSTALMAAAVQRQDSNEKTTAISKSPKRSSLKLKSSLRLAVKKSTMMFSCLSWHKGMNRAMAAPAPTPVNSKSPMRAASNTLRLIRL